MKIQKFTFNPFQENTYIIYDESKECIIIDPGCYSDQEKKELASFIEIKKLKPIKLINTHCHIDHILGNKFVANEWNLELNINELEIPILKSGAEVANIYGFKEYIACKIPSEFINENDIIKFGKSELTVFLTPGHSPGHISLYSKKHNILISGDVIFRNSIGRTDLPGGNYSTLLQSIKNKILNLPLSTKILCGHGPTTNIKEEIENNPFIN